MTTTLIMLAVPLFQTVKTEGTMPVATKWTPRSSTDYSVGCLAFSQCGKWLAVGYGDGAVIMGSVRQKSLRTQSVTSAHKWAVGQVGFSPHGKVLVSMSRLDPFARLWTVTPTGKLQHLRLTYQHRALVDRFALSADGQYIATAGGKDRTVQLEHLRKAGLTRRTRARGHSGVVSSVVISDDGKQLASLGDKLVVWQLGEKPRAVKKFRMAPNVDEIIAFRKDKILCARVNRAKFSIAVCKLPTGKTEYFHYRGHTGVVRDIALSSKADTLASVDSKGGLIIWEMGKSRVKAKLRFREYFTAVAVSSDGSLVAAGALGGKVVLIRTESDK